MSGICSVDQIVKVFSLIGRESGIWHIYSNIFGVQIEKKLDSIFQFRVPKAGDGFHFNLAWCYPIGYLETISFA